MKTILLIILSFTICGCAGSGGGGRWTAEDAAAAANATNGVVNAVGNGARTYDQIAHPQYYRP